MNFGTLTNSNSMYSTMLKNVYRFKIDTICYIEELVFKMKRNILKNIYICEYIHYIKINFLTFLIERLIF